MGKPSAKGLSSSNRWATLAMLEEDESVLQRDWLSNLPDDLLLDIIERLDVADAMRTSILSTRWKLIPTMLSKIHIIVGSTDNVQDRTCDAARANAYVLGATRSLLESRSTSPYTIHRLCMQFFLGDASIRIGQTVAKTMATQKVACAELTVLTEMEFKRCDEVANGKQFASFFNACPNTFSCLTRLKLENLRLGESDFFPKLLRLCERLEFLCLDHCDMGSMSLLSVEHPRLREIEIFWCDFERVDLNWLPELTTLTFSCWKSLHYPLSFGYVPLLHSASIGNAALEHEMLKLSEFLGKATISILCLGFGREKIWVKPEDPRELSQVFSKLRVVHLTAISDECDLTWTMFVLQGAPFLEELGIKVCNCPGIWDEHNKQLAHRERKDAGAKWEASDFKHRNLYVLRIFGFQPEDKFVDYAKAVMEAAVNLEDIYLHEKPACKVGCGYTPPPQSDRYPRSRREKFLVKNSLGMHMRPFIRLYFVL